MGFLDFLFGRRTQEWYNKQLDELETAIREFQGKIEYKRKWLRHNSKENRDYESWLTMSDEEFAKADPGKGFRGVLTPEQAHFIRYEERLYLDAAQARALSKEVARVQRIISELEADMRRYGYTKTYLKYRGEAPYKKGVWPR